MIVGLPGLGIAGLLYMMLAAAMPISSLMRRRRDAGGTGLPSRQLIARRQTIIGLTQISVGVLFYAGIWIAVGRGLIGDSEGRSVPVDGAPPVPTGFWQPLLLVAVVVTILLVALAISLSGRVSRPRAELNRGRVVPRARTPLPNDEMRLKAARAEARPRESGRGPKLAADPPPAGPADRRAPLRPGRASPGVCVWPPTSATT